MCIIYDLTRILVILFLENNQDIWNNHQDLHVWFIYYYMFKFEMEISIIDSIKLPSVSVSKMCTYRAFPDIFLKSLGPGDILKIIYSILFSSSMYAITCIDMSHKGAYCWEIGRGRVIYPAGTRRNNNVFTTSTRRHRRRVDVVKTLSLRNYCVMCPLGSLAPSDNKPLPGPLLTRFMTPYGKK